MTRYALEVERQGAWYPILHDDSRAYLEGYLAARKEGGGPRLAFRVVRCADGRVIADCTAVEDVSIGQVAGMPTAEQYEAAAEVALQRAAVIRAAAARKAE